MKNRTHHLVKRGKYWAVQFSMDGDRTQKTLLDDSGNKITSEGDAIAARDKLMASYGSKNKLVLLESLAAKLDQGRARQKALAEARVDLPLSGAWATYLDTENRPDTGQATLHQYAVQFDRFVRWMAKVHPEAVSVGDVTEDIATDFMRSLRKENRSTNTRNKYARLLMLVWRVLDKAKAAKVAVNPWTKDTITRGKLEKGTGRRELTLTQLKTLCESAEGELRRLLMLGLYCGLRLGDAARMEWQDVDLLQNAIVTDLHKTGEVVAIPIADPLRRELESVPKINRFGPLLPRFSKTYGKDPRVLQRTIQAHFAECKIQTSEKAAGRAHAIARRGFHSLRHSFITYANMSGWPESLVRSIVGHRSDSVSRLYKHHSVELVKHLSPLPDVLAGETELNRRPSSKPETEIGVDALAKRIKTIAERMDAENWKASRSALLDAINRKEGQP